MLIIMTGIVCAVISCIGSYIIHRIEVRNKANTKRLEALVGLDKEFSVDEEPAKQLTNGK